MSRSLALLLLLVPPFCSLAQDWNDGNGAYGTYGGGDDNTISPAPQINVTQPAPAPPPSMPPQQQPQPNATAPGGGGTGDNATAFLPITLNNNNSWTMNGRAHEQNNYLMQNMASRSICDVSIKAPIASGDGTRISSSYNVDLRNITAEAMHFDLPFYLQKIWPGQIISFGWVLNSDKNGTATGAMATVTHARFCDNDNDDGTNNGHRLRRHRVLIRSSPCA